MTLEFISLSKLFHGNTVCITGVFLHQIRSEQLPLQSRPSPTKPDLQSQLYVPGLFVQVAFSWQSSKCNSHSFMSKTKTKITK